MPGPCNIGCRLKVRSRLWESKSKIWSIQKSWAHSWSLAPWALLGRWKSSAWNLRPSSAWLVVADSRFHSLPPSHSSPQWRTHHCNMCISTLPFWQTCWMSLSWHCNDITERSPVWIVLCFVIWDQCLRWTITCLSIRVVENPLNEDKQSGKKPCIILVVCPSRWCSRQTGMFQQPACVVRLVSKCNDVRHLRARPIIQDAGEGRAICVELAWKIVPGLALLADFRNARNLNIAGLLWFADYDKRYLDNVSWWR